MYYIYILRCEDQSLYTGITTDIKRRYQEHIKQTPRAAKYTKSHQVIALVALWSSDNRCDASKVEYCIKRLTKDKKESIIKDPKLLNNYLKEKIDLCLLKHEDISHYELILKD